MLEMLEYTTEYFYEADIRWGESYMLCYNKKYLASCRNYIDFFSVRFFSFVKI